MWIEIDAAEKGRLGVLAGINEPGLLMLAETRVRAIPSNAHLMVIPSQQFEVLGRAPECIALQRFCLASGRQKMTRTSTPRLAARSSTARAVPLSPGIRNSGHMKVIVAHTL
jgi:hypothetical protein